MIMRTGTRVTVVRLCPKTGTRSARQEIVTRSDHAAIFLSDGSAWPAPFPGADRVFHPDRPHEHLEVPHEPRL